MKNIKEILAKFILPIIQLIMIPLIQESFSYLHKNINIITASQAYNYSGLFLFIFYFFIFLFCIQICKKWFSHIFNITNNYICFIFIYLFTLWI